MPFDARLGLVWFGYAVALASMAYSLITAFATRSNSSAIPRDRATLPPVTILKPLFGAEPETYECLRSFCQQAYPHYQVIFGVCDPQDPAVAVVHRLQKDFPDLALKPVDTPYGPYLDGFNETQHKYGPFAPIRAALARLKPKSGSAR